jgi:Kef-type K+ transport system membrane component KefB
MLMAVRPMLGRLCQRWEKDEPTRGQIALVLIAVLLSALITEAIGVHAIFGAFLLGAIIPHESRLAQTLNRQMHNIVTTLLLPAFFAYTGMRTRIDLLGESQHWWLCGLIILVATAGKWIGTLAAARWTGMNWRDSLALGCLMNTRGLMEVIVLNIGLDLRVISPTLFSMMVLMALATTIATSPILRLLNVATDDDQAQVARAA